MDELGGGETVTAEGDQELAALFGRSHHGLLAFSLQVLPEGKRLALLIDAVERLTAKDEHLLAASGGNAGHQLVAPKRAPRRNVLHVLDRSCEDSLGRNRALLEVR